MKNDLTELLHALLVCALGLCIVAVVSVGWPSAVPLVQSASVARAFGVGAGR